MALAPGRHEIGPDAASLLVKTYREGLAAKVGHDLVIEVADWSATVEVSDDPAGSSFALDADSRSMQVREGVGGAKPLGDKESAWGIQPYRGMMGALKVRDELEILVDARLPAG